MHVGVDDGGRKETDGLCLCALADSARNEVLSFG